MGALMSYRKRRADINLNSPVSSPYSPDLDRQADTPLLKKPKNSSLLLTPERVVSSEDKASRIKRYPEPHQQLRREIHGPCRKPKFSISQCSIRESGSKTGQVSKKGYPFDEMGNILSTRYNEAKKLAIDTLQYFTEDKLVGNVDMGRSSSVVSEDSSLEEFDMLDGGQGLSVASKQRFSETHTNICSPVSYAKYEDYDPRPSASALSDITHVTQKVDRARKMKESLSVNHGQEQQLDRLPHRKLHLAAKKRNSTLSYLNFQIKFFQRRWLWFFWKCPVKKSVEDVPGEPFVPLKDEEEVEVSRAFSSSYRRKILVTHENSNIEITGEILQCLRGGGWLNDEVINIYFELLKEREKREPKRFLKCHFFNTFFYKKLISGRNGYDYKAVRRWTTQRKIGYDLIECDKIFVPIHKEIHWCLAVINKKDEKFQYLDSLKGRDSQVLKILARYYVDEVKDKSGIDINASSWQLEYVDDLPEQENGWDCGMFMIKYTDFYSRGLGLCFKQEHIPYFRTRTAKEILRLKAE